MKNKNITKDDLKNLATKSDIKKLVNKSAAKAELKSVEKNLRAEILKIEERVENLETGQNRIEKKVGNLELGQREILDQMRKQHDEVMTVLSNFAGNVEDLEEENSLGANHYRDHEKRISKLENTAAAA